MLRPRLLRAIGHGIRLVLFILLGVWAIRFLLDIVTIQGWTPGAFFGVLVLTGSALLVWRATIDLRRATPSTEVRPGLAEEVEPVTGRQHGPGHIASQTVAGGGVERRHRLGDLADLVHVRPRQRPALGESRARDADHADVVKPEAELEPVRHIE